MHQFFRLFTFHTPTIQQSGNPFVVCNLYASHLAVASSLPSQYRCLLERDVFLDRGSSDSNTPLLQRQCCNDNNSIYTEAINLLLPTSSENTLNFAIWSTLLRV